MKKAFSKVMTAVIAFVMVFSIIPAASVFGAEVADQFSEQEVALFEQLMEEIGEVGFSETGTQTFTAQDDQGNEVSIELSVKLFDLKARSVLEDWTTGRLDNVPVGTVVGAIFNFTGTRGSFRHTIFVRTSAAGGGNIAMQYVNPQNDVLTGGTARTTLAINMSNFIQTQTVVNFTNGSVYEATCDVNASLAPGTLFLQGTFVRTR